MKTKNLHLICAQQRELLVLIAGATTTTADIYDTAELLRSLIPRRVGPTKPPAACVRDTPRALLWADTVCLRVRVELGFDRYRVLHYYLNFAWHDYGITHGIPWHLHSVPWRGMGFHGAPWGVLWHATGGTIATPVATATALHDNPTECHGNPHGTPMFTAPT